MSLLIAKNSFGTGVRLTLAAGIDLEVPHGIAITSSDAAAVTARGSSHAVHVIGLVSGDTAAITFDGAFADTQALVVAAGGVVSSIGTAVSIAAGHARLENHGTITGTTSAVLIGTDHAVTDVMIANAGAIQGAIIAASTRTTALTNTGSITAAVPSGDAIALTGGAATVTNDGAINGAVHLTNAADKLINHGTILGALDLGAGNDFVDNHAGDIEGTIQLGAGDDLFIHGAVHNRIDGGSGYDTLDFSQSSPVTIALDRSLSAGGAAQGSSFFNFEAVIGSDAGGDRIIGSSADNRLDGRGGNDTLSGLAGRDTLLGGAGKDTLIGGAGTDLYSGGAGADTFVFADGDFGGVTRALGDRVTDFRHAQHDRIDLSGVDANSLVHGHQGFTYIGLGHFHHTAGEVRLVLGADESTLFGDTDGDGAADFRIVLDGHINLHAEDFVL